MDAGLMLTRQQHPSIGMGPKPGQSPTHLQAQNFVLANTAPNSVPNSGVGIPDKDTTTCAKVKFTQSIEVEPDPASGEIRYQILPSYFCPIWVTKGKVRQPPVINTVQGVTLDQNSLTFDMGQQGDPTNPTVYENESTGSTTVVYEEPLGAVPVTFANAVTTWSDGQGVVPVAIADEAPASTTTGGQIVSQLTSTASSDVPAANAFYNSVVETGSRWRRWRLGAMSWKQAYIGPVLTGAGLSRFADGAPLITPSTVDTDMVGGVSASPAARRTMREMATLREELKAMREQMMAIRLHQDSDSEDDDEDDESGYMSDPEVRAPWPTPVPYSDPESYPIQLPVYGQPDYDKLSSGTEIAGMNGSEAHPFNTVVQGILKHSSSTYGWRDVQPLQFAFAVDKKVIDTEPGSTGLLPLPGPESALHRVVRRNPTLFSEHKPVLVSTTGPKASSELGADSSPLYYVISVEGHFELQGVPGTYEARSETAACPESDAALKAVAHFHMSAPVVHKQLGGPIAHAVLDPVSHAVSGIPLLGPLLQTIIGGVAGVAPI